MKPVIPNPKEPWKVCKKQLEELDKYILDNLPGAKLSEGVKYARWAELTEHPLYRPAIDDPFLYDNLFHGKLMGKEVWIYMWLPFFE